MKKYLFILGIIAILFIFTVPNCQLPLEEEGEGNVIIETPSKINPAMKSVINDSGAITNIDQKRFRYDLIIEDARTGKRIAIKHLYSNEKAVITVPSGRPLNFYVGVYLATSSRSYYETYNVYLASDKLANVRIMPGETQHLEFVLDVNKGLKADSYFLGTLFGERGIANITGGVNSGDGTPLPYFSADPLTTSITIPDSIIFGFSSTLVLDTSRSSPDPAATKGRGRLFDVGKDTVVQDPDGRRFWYLDDSTGSVYKSTTGYNGFTLNSPSVPASTYPYIPRLKFAKSIYVDDDPNYYYYYFFSYGDGYLCARNIGSAWSSLTRIDFSYLKSLYPYEDFLLDIEQDSSPNEEYTYFASKIGLFYIHHSTLEKFTREDGLDGKQQAIKELNKLIRIKNPADPRKMILIRKVRVIGNRIYLGTRQGVYYINKSSSAWAKFQSASRYTYRIFPEDEIHKMKDFYDEPVISMDIVSAFNLLVIATPKRIYFHNTSTGKEKMITVWDGLPFTPMQQFKNAPELNPLDFTRHEVAPIKFVLWNNSTQRFWVGTDYGLASIPYTNIF